MLAVYLATHNRPSSVFAAGMLWGCIIAGVLLMVSAAVQTHFGNRNDAIWNVLVGVIYILLALFTPIISG